ncbi:MAG: hypothetical protein KatS3mg042_0645 [Rhodothermaceae bacterium]|nr:MAG: hypothetical protein KatS3mg042_0645 [Rhodothermaceae bacterium]
MGSGRAAAASKRARPARSEPVKPTARVCGCRTSASPVSGVAPWRREKVPGGKPVAATARSMARPTSSEVPGCAGWALHTTGQPAASAEAVSPPATEKARGKLLAPKTTTGPRGTSIRRTSGFGTGRRSGSAVSMRAPTHEPSRTTSAKRRSWPVVRPRSPRTRPSGRPVSAITRSMSTSPSASISSAMRSRSAARSSGVRVRPAWKASVAASSARSISSGVASG